MLWPLCSSPAWQHPHCEVASLPCSVRPLVHTLRLEETTAFKLGQAAPPPALVSFPGFDGGQVCGRDAGSLLIPMGLGPGPRAWGLATLTARLPAPPAACPEPSPTLCCRHPSCWRGCCPGGGCRAASQAGWPADPGAAASWQGVPTRARASTAGKAGPVGTGGRGRLGRPWAREQSRATHHLPWLTCHRAHPRLRASAAMYHRTVQGRGCLSMGRASRASAVARSLGSGSSIMVRTERSSEDRPVPGAGPHQG